MNHIKNYVRIGIFSRLGQLVAVLLAASFSVAQAPTSNISDPAYQELTNRVTANAKNFYVYQDQDSGFNHGFPSGLFGTGGQVEIDPGCLDDPADMVTGCFPSSDMTHLDRVHGTVLRVSFPSESGDQYTGLNIEEPEQWGIHMDGVGYDLLPATQLRLDVRSPTGIKLQFGVGGCQTNFISIPQSSTYTTMTIPISSMLIGSCPPDLSNAHVLFTVVTNAANAPNGGTVLVDNVRFTPVPGRTNQGGETLSFPLATQTFGVVPQQNPEIPPDQNNRNVTTIYESALTLLALLHRGNPTDITNALQIAKTFDYALFRDNHGDPLPQAPGNLSGCYDGSPALQCGLHSVYESGDIGLLNGQRSGLAQAGDVRLAGFTAGTSLCGSSGFCLVQDGATGGNNAFAVLGLAAAYEESQNPMYLNDALAIANWIVANLTSNEGYRGYYVGYTGVSDFPLLPHQLILGKSTENNSDIFAAFTALAGIELQLGNSGAASLWTTRADLAGDFVMLMFDAANGRFNAGTVPVGTFPGPGVCPSGPPNDNDVLNVCDFLDSGTFPALALAATQRYGNQINWQLPIEYVWNVFPQSIMADGLTFQGFDIIPPPPIGPSGIAWEFTGQPVETCSYVDYVFGSSTCGTLGQFYLGQIGQAQTSAPFGDRLGLVASTLPNGDQLLPKDQCLNTSFQCIPERVGLAATAWAIFAELKMNPLAIPVVVLSPSSLDFGPQGLHRPITPLTSVLANAGNGPLTITNIAVTGADSGDFSQWNDCPMSPNALAPGNSCKIMVIFTPTQTGPRSATVTIMDDAPNTPQTISLTGTGVGGKPSLE